MGQGGSLVTKGRIFRALENATRGVIFAGGVSIPTLISLFPDSGNQGVIFEVTLTGTNLNTVIGISFGSGIIIDTPSIKTKTTIVVMIRIDGNAILGYRDVIVTSATGASTLVNGFRVLPRVISPSTGGGAGGLTGVLKPILVIKKRKYVDDAIAVKVQKAWQIESVVSIGISKRVEVADSLALGVSQTLLDSSSLLLSVDKQGDFAAAEILQSREYSAASMQKAIVLETKPNNDYDVEPLPSEEMHVLTLNQGYNEIERRVYYVGGQEDE